MQAKTGMSNQSEVYVKEWDKRSSNRTLYNIAVACGGGMGMGFEWIVSGSDEH